VQLNIGTTTLELSERRAAIAERLARRAWFRATDPALQVTLLTLPEDAAKKDDWTGYLDDLADRPDTLGGVRVVKLVALLRANFAVTSMFEVVNIASGLPYTYEYVSWKHGTMSGSKGVAFVRASGVITHFVVLRGEKFATGTFVWDTLGGFADLGSDGVVTIPDRIAVEIREELGASDLRITDVIDLGRIFTDAGMTNNCPGVFAAVIDALDAQRITTRPVNPDERELTAAVYVLPISQLSDHVMVNGDTFFQTAVLRSVAQGIIPAHYLAPAAG